MTTVRDLGSNYLNISRFNKGVRNGLYAGPRVFYSALWAAGNYFMDPMDSIGWEGEGGRVSRGKADYRGAGS